MVATMAENYKHLYHQMKLMLEKYQDEIVPGLREQLEKRVEVVRCKDCVDEQRCRLAQHLGENGFCSYGERKEG